MVYKYPQIYLASASPRRHELLNQIGVKHTVLEVPSAPGEDEPRLPGEAPMDYVQRTALEKANRAHAWLTQTAKASGLERLPILAADTTVALGNEVLGKPKDVEDAQRMLALLSGQTHTVLTSVVLLTEFELKKALSISEVSFMRLSPQQIVDYVESKEPFGKAGAYAIQGFAGAFIDKLKGSYTGVMGLPLHETLSLLSV